MVDTGVEKQKREKSDWFISSKVLSFLVQVICWPGNIFKDIKLFSFKKRFYNKYMGKCNLDWWYNRAVLYNLHFFFVVHIKPAVLQLYSNTVMLTKWDMFSFSGFIETFYTLNMVAGIVAMRSQYLQDVFRGATLQLDTECLPGRTNNFYAKIRNVPQTIVLYLIQIGLLPYV